MDDLRDALDQFYAGFEAIEGVENDGGFMCAAPGIWPKKSFGARVHPSQIKQATAQAKKKGVSIKFDKNGDAVFADRQNRKDYLEKVRGLYDMDGGYGDPQQRTVFDG